MEKPFVVCHMLTSLDGKIDGAYMADPACAAAREKYGELRGFYSCDATLYGTTTMLGGYSSGRAPDKLPNSPAYEGDETRALAAELGYIPVVPPKSSRKDPWDYDKVLYKQRNQVERLFRRIKRFRRIFTRYDKLDVIFF